MEAPRISGKPDTLGWPVGWLVRRVSSMQQFTKAKAWVGSAVSLAIGVVALVLSRNLLTGSAQTTLESIAVALQAIGTWLGVYGTTNKPVRPTSP